MRERWIPARWIVYGRFERSQTASRFGCMWMEVMVRASDDFEMVAPVELSIFCFRHVPVQLRNQSPKAIDAFNERLLVALQRDGSSYLSNAIVGGRFALRGCVLNYRTTLRDMEILLDDLRRVATSLPTSAWAQISRQL